MNETPHLDQLLRVDRVCDQFEHAWLTGERPRIEDFLGDSANPERAVIFRALLSLEVHYRRQNGEEPTLEEYRPRFPDQQSDFTALVSPGTSQLPPTIRDVEDAPAQPPSLSASGYEILGTLGRGGMGVVYKARDDRLNRIVALKMILAGAHASVEEVKRLRKEAEAAARLQHPNIVQIYEIGEHEGLPFLALEYVDGSSLSDFLARCHRAGNVGMLPGQAAGIVETLARAIHYAHENGIVHRDLKPANILLSGIRCRGSGISNQDLQDSVPNTEHRALNTPKITDFGLAKSLDDATLQTQTGVLLGTPSYMAPEQAGGTVRAIGPPTDVYALGVTLYVLLTGRVPFQAATLADTLEQVRNAEPAPPRQLQPKVPRDLETICLKCLQKESSTRYFSAEDLADDLRRFQAGEPILARPVSFREKTIKWIMRRPVVSALGAVIVTITVFSFVVVLYLLGVEAEARKKAQASDAKHTMALTRVYWEKGDFDKAKAYLKLCPREFRDREWRRLHRQLHAQLLKIDIPRVISWLKWSGDNRTVIGSEGSMHARSVHLWDAATGAKLYEHQLKLMCVPVHQMSLANKGRQLVFAGATESVKGKRMILGFSQKPAGTLQVVSLDLSSRKRSKLFELAVPRQYQQFEWGLSPEARWLCLKSTSGNESAPWKIINLSEKNASFTLAVSKQTPGIPPDTIRISADNKRFIQILANDAGRLYTVGVSELESKNLIFSQSIASRRCPCPHFNPDGNRLLCTYEPAGTAVSSAISCWDVATGRQLFHRESHDGFARDAVVFSPDGNRIAWMEARHEILVVDARTGKELLSLRGHTKAIRALAFSHDDVRLASYSLDGTIRIWDVRPIQ